MSQYIGFSVNFIPDPLGDLFRFYRLHADTEFVYFSDPPHFKTVGHILYGAFHSAAGGGGDDNGLLPLNSANGR